ncbi:hypothetical protein BBJ28_00015815 [Nothophytophthora sp. Chile5]|nr:hypothetical protein BBJ28_00015815 [Nothophytophthora sp. Chile5]
MVAAIKVRSLRIVKAKTESWEKMMESNFQRRASGYGSKLGAAGSSKGSLSPKGTIKKKKQERKAKEQQTQLMHNLNAQIGRLEDRDTQQQAFAMLLPVRSSTRRMLVLLMAALCRCHSASVAKLLPRVLAYLSLRLRDRQTKVTEACVILVSAVALYVLPCSSLSLSSLQLGSPSRRSPPEPSSTKEGELTAQKEAFEAVAAVLTKEANAVGEAATRCLCGLLRPVDFDGVSVPGPDTMLAHVTRIRSFFKKLLADSVAKLDGSTVFASFSSAFLLLQSACQLAREVHEKAAFSALGEDFAPYVASIYEAIEDAFQCGPRDDWLLRKRGLELLTLLLDAFALQESAWCSAVPTAKAYFQSNVERVRALVVAGRHDAVSLVRDAAIPAALAFEWLEKQCPQAAGGVGSSLLGNPSANYDFVPPSPPSYSFSSKRRVKAVGGTANDTEAAMGDEERPLTMRPVMANPAKGQDLSVESSRRRGTADVGLPDFSDPAMDEELPPSADSTEAEHPVVKERRTRRETVSVPALGATEAGDEKQSLLADSTEEEETFDEFSMDEAVAPENTEEMGIIQQTEEEPSKVVPPTAKETQRKTSVVPPESAHIAASSVLAPAPAKTASPLASAVHAASTLKQFVAKRRAQTRSLRPPRQDVSQLSPPSRRSPSVNNAALTFSPDHEGSSAEPNVHSDEDADDSKDTEAWSRGYQLTRAEAALEAAQCGEHELAIRLCLLEDDLELLRRTMTLIGSPCMATLSTAARDALCTAFLSLLDGDAVGDSERDTSSDAWLALQWLQQWATDLRPNQRQRQVEGLDPRVANALAERLGDMALASSKAALAAAHVLFLLGL